MDNDHKLEVWITILMQIGIIFLVAMGLSYIISRLIRGLEQKADEANAMISHEVLDALRRPIRLFIWVLAITYSAEIVKHVTPVPVLNAVGSVRVIGVITSLVWFLLGLVKNFENKILEGQAKIADLNKFNATVLTRLMRVVIFIVATLVTLDTLGFDINGALTVGGVGGVALGFAGKDVLANFFGAITIYFDQPFKIGDWVRSPDKNIEGYVEDISWRVTKIRTFDRSPLYVPNSVFTNIIIENKSRMSHRRFNEHLGVRYDDVDKLPKIIEDVDKYLRGHSKIDKSHSVIVGFDSFNASSIEFAVQALTKTTNKADFIHLRQEIMLEIYKIIKKHKADIPYQTNTFHMINGGP
jgi:MscS family membrane protein